MEKSSAQPISISLVRRDMLVEKTISISTCFFEVTFIRHYIEFAAKALDCKSVLLCERF